MEITCKVVGETYKNTLFYKKFEYTSYYCDIMAIHIVSEFHVVRNALILVNNVDCVR